MGKRRQDQKRWHLGKLEKRRPGVFLGLLTLYERVIYDVQKLSLFVA